MERFEKMRRQCFWMNDLFHYERPERNMYTGWSEIPSPSSATYQGILVKQEKADLRVARSWLNAAARLIDRSEAPDFSSRLAEILHPDDLSAASLLRRRGWRRWLTHDFGHVLKELTSNRMTSVEVTINSTNWRTPPFNEANEIEWVRHQLFGTSYIGHWELSHFIGHGMEGLGGACNPLNAWQFRALVWMAAATDFAKRRRQSLTQAISIKRLHTPVDIFKTLASLSRLPSRSFYFFGSPVAQLTSTKGISEEWQLRIWDELVRIDYLALIEFGGPGTSFVKRLKRGFEPARRIEIREDGLGLL